MIRLVLLSIFLFSISIGGEISIGEKMPGSDFIVNDINGKSLKIGEYKKENGILVIFSCNTCPWVIRWQDRYNPISELCSKNNIGFVAINSNAKLHDNVDSMDEMIYHATVNKYDFPYAMDENAKLAKAFGAMKTPHVYLFDSDEELIYKGAIDNNPKSAKKVTQHYLADAIKSISNGDTVKIKTTKALGCSIKF